MAAGVLTTAVSRCLTPASYGCRACRLSRERNRRTSTANDETACLFLHEANETLSLRVLLWIMWGLHWSKEDEEDVDSVVQWSQVGNLSNRCSLAAIRVIRDAVIRSAFVVQYSGRLEQECSLVQVTQKEHLFTDESEGESVSEHGGRDRRAVISLTESIVKERTRAGRERRSMYK